MTLSKHAIVGGVLLAIATIQPAFGWGQTGHRVTGAIAEHYLTPAAKRAISTIIPNETLAEASTYADDMRSHPSEFWRKTASPWHYVTVPKNTDYHQVGAPAEGDAFTALSQFSAVLTSPTTPRETKQLALRFIVHIIGDLHQPLHSGNGTDRGGNDLKVRFFWQDSNLHRVWDTQLIEQKNLSYTEWTAWLNAKISPSNIQTWSAIDPATWIAESTKIRDTIYPENANDMNYQYLYDHIPTVTLRLQQAGVRIALYLNNLFADVEIE